MEIDEFTLCTLLTGMLLLGTYLGIFLCKKLMTLEQAVTIYNRIRKLDLSKDFKKRHRKIDKMRRWAK